MRFILALLGLFDKEDKVDPETLARINASLEDTEVPPACGKVLRRGRSAHTAYKRAFDGRLDSHSVNRRSIHICRD